jgi:hypothetical protein
MPPNDAKQSYTGRRLFSENEIREARMMRVKCVTLYDEPLRTPVVAALTTGDIMEMLDLPDEADPRYRQYEVAVNAVSSTDEGRKLIEDYLDGLCIKLAELVTQTVEKAKDAAKEAEDRAWAWTEAWAAASFAAERQSAGAPGEMWSAAREKWEVARGDSASAWAEWMDWAARATAEVAAKEAAGVVSSAELAERKQRAEDAHTAATQTADRRC